VTLSWLSLSKSGWTSFRFVIWSELVSCIRLCIRLQVFVMRLRFATPWLTDTQKNAPSHTYTERDKRGWTYYHAAFANDNKIKLSFMLSRPWATVLLSLITVASWMYGLSHWRRDSLQMVTIQQQQQHTTCRPICIAHPILATSLSPSSASLELPGCAAVQGTSHTAIQFQRRRRVGKC